MDVLAIGNALIDIFSFVEDDFSSSIGFHKGTTTHVSEERMENLLLLLNDTVSMAGGSAANTAKLLSRLGLASAYAGKCGNGASGNSFENELQADGVTTFISRSDKFTGLCCTLLGSDGRQTVIVTRGAAEDFTEENVPIESIADASLLYLEMYLMTQRNAVFAALDQAKRSKVRIAVDLSNPHIVKEHRDDIWKIIREYAEIIFATEEEAAALTDLAPIEAAHKIAANCDTFILKRAELGVAAYRGGNEFHVPAAHTTVIDTTGAGRCILGGIPVRPARRQPSRFLLQFRKHPLCRDTQDSRYTH